MYSSCKLIIWHSLCSHFVISRVHLLKPWCDRVDSLSIWKCTYRNVCSYSNDTSPSVVVPTPIPTPNCDCHCDKCMGRWYYEEKWNYKTNFHLDYYSNLLQMASQHNNWKNRVKEMENEETLTNKDQPAKSQRSTGSCGKLQMRTEITFRIWN